MATPYQKLKIRMGASSPLKFNKAELTANISQIYTTLTGNPTKRSGRASVGVCPFHDDHKPSFSLYDDNGSFYCHGCSLSGDTVDLVRQLEGLDFVTAVEFVKSFNP